MAWLAIRGADAERVARALALRNVRPASWHDGISAAYKSPTAVFITPPIEDWILCPGWALVRFSDHRPPDFGALTHRLAVELNAEVQYFCTHRVVEGHAWARAAPKGLERAYCYLGESGETLLNFGLPTREEKELGLSFFDEKSPQAEAEGYWDREDLSVPSELDVVRIAGRWSIDPTRLGDPPAARGLLGRLTGSKPWWRLW